jgi:hypothetical protein
MEQTQQMLWLQALCQNECFANVQGFQETLSVKRLQHGLDDHQTPMPSVSNRRAWCPSA